MPLTLDQNLKRVLAERIHYYNELGIYDFYRRDVSESTLPTATTNPTFETSSNPKLHLEQREQMIQSARSASATSSHSAVIPLLPEAGVSNPVEALRIIREDIGECTRCPLHLQGRKQIVFGVGNPNADLMFIGEAPGADEDQKGEPFVGRAGQLLTNMIKAMGIAREDVYIANIIKCRPPGNRTPERDECATCSPFLMRQIAAVKPKVIVALGAIAAKTLLALNRPMSEFRGRFYDFQGTKLAVTYHPAFLLRDPRQKKETWKDLQMVMKDLGLPLPAKGVE
ncbi:MAG: uracil-DNA glycosylase [Acidobacteriota bacterium]|nr:uracil-DNA glycosylase [Acidobacteriota bacterium]